MKGSLYLAWRYLAYHRAKTVILVLAITLVVWVPAGLRVLIADSARQLTARAADTRLLIGSKGSSLDLVLRTLYFSGESPEPLAYEQVERIRDWDLGTAIPIHARYRAPQGPIVGTTLEYFEHRDLDVERGRPLTWLGECVIGADVAETWGLAPGDHVVSSPENVFDIAGVYPLQMDIVGVLRRAYSPDDEAIFVDLRTTWVIEGLGHGHEDLSRPEAATAVLSRDEKVITANASVREFHRIDASNRDSFHFHGDRSSYPVTSILAVPRDDRSSAFLRGRLQGADEVCQIVQPAVVVDDLLATVFTVQGYVVAAVVFVGLATLATTILVFLLSLKLRRREMETMHKIGGKRSSIAGVIGFEIAGVILASVLLASVLTWITADLGGLLLRSLLLS